MATPPDRFRLKSTTYITAASNGVSVMLLRRAQAVLKLAQEKLLRNKGVAGFQ